MSWLILKNNILLCPTKKHRTVLELHIVHWNPELGDFDGQQGDGILVVGLLYVSLVYKEGAGAKWGALKILGRNYFFQKSVEILQTFQKNLNN